MVWFDLTRAAAAIARQGVAVITKLTRLVNGPIAAPRRSRDLPTTRTAGCDAAATGPDLEPAAGAHERTGTAKSCTTGNARGLVLEFRRSAATRWQCEQTHDSQ